MGARTTALSALIACRKQGAWADGILKEYIVRDRLDRRDAALASRLCYGVLQNRMLLDYEIQTFLHGPIEKLQPVVLDILRLGMYQLRWMDRIPVSAAVNEAVEQGKKYANHNAARLINGVLRHAAREGNSLSLPENLSIRYSHPEPLVALLRSSVGEDMLEPLLRSHNEAPETVIQINPLVSSASEVEQAFQAAGIRLEPHSWLPDAYLVYGAGSVEGMPLFQEGAFWVQDPAARLAAMAAGIQPGMDILDGCAAPGGKSFAAAMSMNNQGRVISCDIHPHKIDLIRRGAERLRIQILQPICQDATVYVPAWDQAMDVVLADVPCSGLGVIRKKPDIRYKDIQSLERLPGIQLRILDNLSRYVKPGGVLVYSTCTILKRENEDVAETFLQQHPAFHLEPFPVPSGLEAENQGMLTLYPHLHACDGFFICKLRKNP